VTLEDKRVSKEELKNEDDSDDADIIIGEPPINTSG
jgi:hypothetical protein